MWKMIYQKKHAVSTHHSVASLFGPPRDDAKKDPVTGTIPRCDASHPHGTEQRNHGASTMLGSFILGYHEDNG